MEALNAAENRNKKQTTLNIEVSFLFTKEIVIMYCWDDDNVHSRPWISAQFLE